MTVKVMSRVLSFSRRSLLATSTLWGAAAVAAPSVAARERQERRLVLSESRPPEVPRGRVAPGGSTLLLFDAELGAVSLEGRGRFAWVEVAGRALVLRPAEALEGGERLEVTFADGLLRARCGASALAQLALWGDWDGSRSARGCSWAATWPGE